MSKLLIKSFVFCCFTSTGIIKSMSICELVNSLSCIIHTIGTRKEISVANLSQVSPLKWTSTEQKGTRSALKWGWQSMKWYVSMLFCDKSQSSPCRFVGRISIKEIRRIIEDFTCRSFTRRCRRKSFLSVWFRKTGENPFQNSIIDFADEGKIYVEAERFLRNLMEILSGLSLSVPFRRYPGQPNKTGP